ncbi:enoyl-CoA hydratase/isomerase family protein [Rhodococcus sp. ACT016]|uniref:enoyl-CoA hydratase/isomerase family protein n=1 Tax=Rhodococcus sp. ACT016 TaxID=3134808 RepID=UPI003D27F744
MTEPEPDRRSVRLIRDGRVATILLDRPDRRNALDLNGFRLLREAIHEVGSDPEIRVAVIKGAGGTFCSGADLQAVRGAHPLDRMREINEAASALGECSKPLIAHVDGFAVGAGWNIALLCDVVVATPEARFAQIFAKRGLSIDFGGSWILPRVVGPHQAKRLTMLAETIDADEALRLGAVTWVVERERIDSFVADVAARLAAGPPVALAQSKQLLDRGVTRTLGEALDAEASAVVVNFGTDATEAVSAFVDKREPVFEGRWGTR